MRVNALFQGSAAEMGVILEEVAGVWANLAWTSSGDCSALLALLLCVLWAVGLRCCVLTLGPDLFSFLCVIGLGRRDLKSSYKLLRVQPPRSWNHFIRIDDLSTWISCVRTDPFRMITKSGLVASIFVEGLLSLFRAPYLCSGRSFFVYGFLSLFRPSGLLIVGQSCGASYF